MHALSPADMCRTVCCPAALMLVLGETAEEVKKQGKNDLPALWRCNSMGVHGHDELFIGMDIPCAEFACLTVAGSAC